MEDAVNCGRFAPRVAPGTRFTDLSGLDYVRGTHVDTASRGDGA
jgi:hypothetical protein